MTNQNTPQIIKDDEIDLIALIKVIWNGRKTVYYSVAIAVIIGLIIAFTSPVKYEASATLLPSEEKEGGNLGGLGALAGMAGINLGSMLGETSDIPAEIYPQVVNSYPFKKEMIHQKFHYEEYDHAMSIYEYYLSDTTETFGSKIVKYTIRLPWTIKNTLLSTKKEDGEFLSKDYGVLNLSKKEIGILQSVEDLILVEVDEKTGLITVSAMAGEPILTAQFVQKAVDLLKDYVIKYKTKQAREHLDFVQARHDEKKKEYEEAQNAFFDYKDRHRNMVSERIDLEFQRLSDRYDMSSTVFKGLGQQLEQAKITVMEETPVFSVLEPVRVPTKKSTPRKKIILVVSVILGGFIGLGIIFGRLIWARIKEKF